MSYLVLARKYRPQNFNDVVRQEHITRTLANAISLGRVAHAILFAGPRGTGKTTVARVLAKAMNCKEGPTPTPCNVCQSCKEITSGNAVDVFEIDGASNNGVEHIRELRENIKYTPAHSKYKIYIIDEVHMLSTSAFNALLKTLEEPPSHVMFIFATTEPHKIPITILSRCQRHDFRRIELQDIANHMANLCRRENIEIDEQSLDIISRESGGSMRDALSLLDQVMSCSEGTIVYEKVLEILGVIDRKILFDLSAGILKGDVAEVLDVLDNIYNQGHNIKELYSALLEHFRHLSVIKITKKVSKLVDLPAHEIQLMSEQVKNVPHTFLLQILDMLFKEESNIRFSSDPKLAMEIAFIRLFAAKPALPIDLLIEKLDDLKKGVYEEPPEPIPVAKPIYRIPETASSGIGESSTPITQHLSPISNCEQAWKKIIEILSKESPALAAVLCKCQCTMPYDDCFKIDVKGNGFDLKLVNSHLPKIKDICNRIFAKPMQVEVRNETSLQYTVVKKKTANKLRQEAVQHPLVKAALEVFKDSRVREVIAEYR